MRRGPLARLAVSALLAACAGGPPPPDWQIETQQAMDAALAAYLAGDTAAEARHLARARQALARTGRPALLARAELMACAARVASLVFEPCAGFEALRQDAEPAERAYAEHLAGRATAEAVALLPPAQQAPARAAGDARRAAAALQDVRDPLSRLVAAGVLLQRGTADASVVGLAVEAASDQGWRRPLLAWLGVQQRLATQAGDPAAAERIRRRIELAGGAAGR